MKSSLWSFANIASTVCVSDDAVSSARAIFATMPLNVPLVVREDSTRARKLRG